MQEIQKNTRRHYEEDFKKEAVRLIEKEGYSLVEASLRLGIPKTTLSKWKGLFGHNIVFSYCAVSSISINIITYNSYIRSIIHKVHFAMFFKLIVNKKQV